MTNLRRPITSLTADQARSISEKVLTKNAENYIQKYLGEIYEFIETAANKGKTELNICTPNYYEEIKQILSQDGYNVSRRNYECYRETVDNMIIKW